MEIKNNLEQLGFSPKEIVVYLAILRLGKTTPAKIAKVTKLNRPTVYSVVKTLISKEVISGDLADKSLHLVPLPLESLKASLEKSKYELKKKEDIVDRAIEELKVITAEKNYSIPKIRFVEQGELKEFLYHNFPKWHKTINDPDGAMYGFQDHSFAENYQDWIEWASEKYEPTKIRVRLFSNKSQVEDKMKGKISVRSVRFLEGSDFTSSIWTVGDYIIMVYSRVMPFYLIEIHDSAMAKNMNDVFRTMWKLTSGLSGKK